MTIIANSISNNLDAFLRLGVPSQRLLLSEFGLQPVSSTQITLSKKMNSLLISLLITFSYASQFEYFVNFNNSACRGVPDNISFDEKLNCRPHFSKNKNECFENQKILSSQMYGCVDSPLDVESIAKPYFKESQFFTLQLY